MKAEELAANVDKPVVVFLNENFNEARATLKAWSRDFTTVYVRLDSMYGKKWRQGMVIELPSSCVQPAKEKR